MIKTETGKKMREKKHKDKYQNVIRKDKIFAISEEIADYPHVPWFYGKFRISRGA